MRLAFLALVFACQGRDADRRTAEPPPVIDAAPAPKPAIAKRVKTKPAIAKRVKTKLPATPEFKQLLVELALARIDPAIHGVRLAWTNEPHERWTWPIYLAAKDTDPAFTGLSALAEQAPPMPQLDDAVRAYVQSMREHLATLSRYVHGWAAAELQAGAEKASAPQIVELFEQLGTTSHALRDVLRRTPAPPASPPNSWLAMVRACVAAIESVAYNTGAILAERSPTPTVYKLQPFAEAASRTRACTVAAMDYVEYGEGDVYDASLGFGVCAGAFRDLGERRGGSQSSSTGVQSMMYLADRVNR